MRPTPRAGTSEVPIDRAARLSFAAAMRDRLQRTMSLAVTLAAAALVAAALVAACGNALPSPSPLPSLPPPTSASETAPATPPPTMVPPESLEPEPSDTDTGAPGTPPCDIGALKASRGITEVIGDERATEVVLVAAETCSVDAFPALRLEDGDGTELVAAGAGGPGGIDLVGGVAYTTSVRLSNWCLGDPDYPVSIGVRHGIGALIVTGDSFPEEGDLPACVHPDADPTLSGTAWAPRP